MTEISSARILIMATDGFEQSELEVPLKQLEDAGADVSIASLRTDDIRGWDGSDWGMTCNSFASVSLEPRLVLWSIRKAASSLEAFTQSGGFTVNVLSNQQEAIARQFATGDMASRFSGVPVQRQASQRQRLTDAMAWFDCQLHQLVDAGDHHIVIGQVNEFGWHEDAQALGFCRSRFGQFEALAA